MPCKGLSGEWGLAEIGTALKRPSIAQAIARAGVTRDAPNRHRDVARIERGGGHLIKQRLKQVMIPAIDQGHPHGCSCELARRVEAPETPAQDDYVGPWVGHSPTS